MLVEVHMCILTWLLETLEAKTYLSAQLTPSRNMGVTQDASPYLFLASQLVELAL